MKVVFPGLDCNGSEPYVESSHISAFKDELWLKASEAKRLNISDLYKKRLYPHPNYI